MQINSSTLSYIYKATKLAQCNDRQCASNIQNTDRAAIDATEKTKRNDISGSSESNKNELSNNRNADSSETIKNLSEEELRQVEEMKKRDRNVRAHELAHLASAGPHAVGGIHLEMKRGPDGQQYAVGGEVNIDTSAVPNDPRATIAKANQIKAAALAPADPSSTDRSVAQAAVQMAMKAQAELVQQQLEENSKNSNEHAASVKTGDAENDARRKAYRDSVKGNDLGKLLDIHA